MSADNSRFRRTRDGWNPNPGRSLAGRGRPGGSFVIRYFSLALLLGTALLASAQAPQVLVLPLELRQPETLWNLRSQRGVPISTVSNVPPGSDGRMTNYNESGSALLPTTNQFASLVSFGGLPGFTSNQWITASNSAILRGTNAFSQAVALEMKLPVGYSNSAVVIVLRRAQIGAPFLLRQVSFPFGSVIAAPSTDESGLPLTNIAASAYWLPEPRTTNGHTNSGYYWSPHAQTVYAIQPGPISVRWIKATYSTTQPGDYTNNPASYYTNAGNYFRLYTVSYIVSGSPVKTPRRIYWTEKGFNRLGKPITVPAARIGAVNIAYNNNFPRVVTEQYVGPGDTDPTAGTTNATLQELRTLWYDQTQGGIFAYNQEGRAFLELLGDPSPDGQTREPLGFEIVDVFKHPTPLDVPIELGDRVTPPTPGDLAALTPEPVPQNDPSKFAYSHNVAGSDMVKLFAISETANENDYLVHWMETGEVGLKWPAYLGRYQFAWPADTARYSHYVRPLVASETEAKLTAVPMATLNVPTIVYQDPLDEPRAKLTEDFKFYTFLDEARPLHRTLLQFTSGEHVAFERVFSWLDVNLKSGSFPGSTIAAGLVGWNATNSTLQFPNPMVAPRVVNATVDVGQRLTAPAGETGSGVGAGYWAGHLHEPAGRSYNPNSYIDPFVAGLPAASLGAIIPVNAIPGTNQLEVWWFRPNGADVSKGFVTNHWPSVIGRYTIQWPVSPREIVLASKLGSEGDGPLNSFEAAGSIYTQNESSLPGYNPNEEHAIMSGGTAFATRDDLNNTNTAGYSSRAFVLLQYVDGDGRPAMSTFQVLREKPAAGWVFDYITEAGRLLQAPMPLPLLAAPVEGSGDNATNSNTESDGGLDLPGGWSTNASSSDPFGHYDQFTYRDRKQNFWVYRGPHAGLPALQAGRYIYNSNTFTPITVATGIVGSAFSLNVHVSRQDEYLAMTVSNAPAWLTMSGLKLSGTPATNDVRTNTIQVVITDLYDQSRVTNSFVLLVLTNGTVFGQDALVVPSTNTYTGSIISFSNRPPFLARSPNPSNSFTMRYYYKTEPGFAWPGVPSPPPVGSIVPYLRPLTNGGFAGDPASKDTPALDIVYRPFWPERDPSDSTKPLATVPYGLTLAKPANGLPGIRDWKTALVLYQQSIAANVNIARVSVVLHDPTREKTASLAEFGLQEIPASVRTETYQGKVYFPNLPPHLGKRLFFDPNRGANGSLVFRGEFKDETVGEDYLLLNVLRDTDLATANALCPVNDTVNASHWVDAITGLATSIETFYENPDVPGSYIPDPDLTVSVGVQNLAEVTNHNTAVDSYALSATGPGSGYITLVEAGGTAFTEPGDPVALHVFKVGGSLHTGELKVLPAENPLSEMVTFQHSPDLAGRFDEYEYEWKIAAPVGGQQPVSDTNMSAYLALTSGTDLPRYLLGGAGIRVLGDNYVTLRYRPVTNSVHPLAGQWSDWTAPQLAEGWIKRVLAGINPFNQRVTDLFNNAVNTDASLITQAGHRWEGDVALNLDTINSYGLIEIYETILRRGRSISIESGYNYGPANDALLLAAGYLSDLYMLVGDEAWADAANPTIGIGTADNTYGDIATALFAFKGQTASLLEEELALVRGRDDFLLPGVATAPVYNRLVWNYTRGIDAGEVIYAINYNVQENPNQTPDGVINAEDAARMFPQGHGDAYGHYLTALKGYYSLLLNQQFDWVPRIEAVTVLGLPVSVDYQDERKFAAAAAAVARAGRQVFDLTWRKDYQPGHDTGWSHLAPTRVNTQRAVPTTRHWGLDHWASRAGQGGYLNWVVGNGILPAVDPNPAHEGIQKIDRTTVPELTELATMAADLQTAMDNAEGGLTPLGLPQGSVALDINPNAVVGTDNGTHFEQIYGRAKVTLNNAVAAFDDAKDVTRLLRSEQDSLAEFQAAVARQELAYSSALIELYGTPYPDDIGPGGTFAQGYAGPDLIHFAYTDMPQLTFPGLLTNTQPQTFQIDIQDFTANYNDGGKSEFGFLRRAVLNNTNSYTPDLHYISFTLDSSGSFQKPTAWTGRRSSPGKVQEAIARIHLARTAALGTLSGHEALKRKLDSSFKYFQTVQGRDEYLHKWDLEVAQARLALDSVVFVAEMVVLKLEQLGYYVNDYAEAAKLAIPQMTIFGAATGGDISSAARSAIQAQLAVAQASIKETSFTKKFFSGAFTVFTENYLRLRDAEKIQPLLRSVEHKQAVLELDATLVELQQTLYTINQRLQELDDAERNYRTVLAQGDRLQQERQVYRQRASAVVQGYRTRDAGFRIFRDEKLERYKTLFDLAARYAFLSANAYDYETGLLDTTAGRSFVNRIINSRALGVVRNGEPQYAGSSTGDPGLSSALAEMKADWDVIRGRLGFNNPDAYGTTLSLRTENFRILPSTNSDTNWQDLLQQSRKTDLLADEDVRRHCLQLSRGNGLAVPGIVIEFSTTIASGYNFFGQPLAAGDHAFSPSSFATKIFGVGAALEGYRGMDEPAANGGTGGNSPPDPNLWFLDPLALAATPYVYLIPVGVDSMRSPPLGDASAIRSWTVDDVAIPLPFNIGASELASGGLYQSSDSLSEPLFTVRKHQAFRPVPSASYFSTSLYGQGGTLLRSQYTNNRLIGRSAWNSRWKLVIPGHTMLNDPDEGLERFIKTVRDIKLHFVTYSYSGN